MKSYLVFLSIKGARRAKVDEEGNVGIEVLAKDDAAFERAMMESEAISSELDDEVVH